MWVGDQRSVPCEVRNMQSWRGVASLGSVSVNHNLMARHVFICCCACLYVSLSMCPPNTHVVFLSCVPKGKEAKIQSVDKHIPGVQPIAANICPPAGNRGASRHPAPTSPLCTVWYQDVFVLWYPWWVCSETLENQETSDAQFPLYHTVLWLHLSHVTCQVSLWESHLLHSSWRANSRTVEWIVRDTAWTC